MGKFNRSNIDLPKKRGRGRLLGQKQIARKKIPKPRGRPAMYNVKVSNEICQFLAQGMPLTQICRMVGMPSYPTVMDWLWRETEYKADFLNRYATAREQQADYMADDLLTIADDSRNDYMVNAIDESGAKIFVTNKENIMRSRLRIDTRKWIAAKLKPKKYGEKIQQEVTGADGTPLNPQVPGDVIFDFGIESSKEGS